METEQHIPTILGVFLLVIGLGSLFFLVENSQKIQDTLFAQASAELHPKNVTVSNVGDTSFTINWITDKSAIGSVIYKEKNLLTDERTSFDTRGIDSYYTHSVTVSNTKPDTNYTFKIINNNKTFTDPKYKITTGISLSPPSQTLDPTYGTLIDRNQIPVNEALVYASFDGSQTLSSVVTNGSWVVPLAFVRSKKLDDYFTPTSSTQLLLNFINADSKSLVKTTLNNHTGLSVELGKSYDHVSEGNLNSSGLIIAQTKEAEEISGSVTNFSLLTPEKNATLTSGRPLFSGMAYPEKSVLLSIVGGDNTVTAKTTAAGNGRWSWTPTEHLKPGNYTVIVSSYDADNGPVKNDRIFSINTSGSQVLSDHTPSSSGLATPSPTPIGGLDDPTPTPSATATSSSTTIPTTGSAEYTYFLFAIALGFIALSGIAFVSNKQ